MSVKNELQQINNRLDKCRHKLDAAKTRNDQIGRASCRERVLDGV